jgi:LysM repeat protein
VNYIRKDGYLEHSTTGSPTVAGYVPATDTSYYDAFGRRIAVSQTSQSNGGAAQNTTRVFAYDSTGEILQRRSGTVSGSTFTAFGPSSIDHYTYVNGQQLSDLDEGGDISVLRDLTGFSDSASTQAYVVQQGDTLASIAQAVYGNSSYSYIVAEANGLSGDGDLVVGQSITIPSVTTSSNTANTFKPYDPGQVVGSTTPSLPAVPPPPPPDTHCAAVATIIVAVAVAIIAPELGPVFAAGMGGGAGAYAAGYFMAGFVADSAGQFASDVVGASQGYSWKEAAITGLTVAASVGVADKLGTGTATTSGTTWVNSAGNLTFAGGAVTGASDYAVNVAASHVVGQASQFSWDGLIASSLGSAVTAASGLPTSSQTTLGTPEKLWEGIEGGVLQGAVTRESSAALGDHRVQSWQDIFADAFGNALGNAAVGEINSYEASRAQRDYINTMSPVDVKAPPLVVGNILPTFPAIGPVADVGPAVDSPAGSDTSGGNVADVVTQSVPFHGLAGAPAADWYSLGDYATENGKSDQVFSDVSEGLYKFNFLPDGSNPDTPFLLVEPALQPTVEAIAPAGGMLSMSYADPNESPGLLTYDFSAVQRQDLLDKLANAPVSAQDQAAFMNKQSLALLSMPARPIIGTVIGSINLGHLVLARYGQFEASHALAQSALYTDSPQMENEALSALNQLNQPVPELIAMSPLDKAGAEAMAAISVGNMALDAPAVITQVNEWVGALSEQESGINAVTVPNEAVPPYSAGEFSVLDWTGYPEGVPTPEGPFRLLEGSEYDAARNAANAANKAIRADQDLIGQPVDVHEIQPVKFGGDPADPANKIILPRDVHRQQVTPWWNQLQRDIGG